MAEVVRHVPVIQIQDVPFTRHVHVPKVEIQTVEQVRQIPVPQIVDVPVEHTVQVPVQVPQVQTVQRQVPAGCASASRPGVSKRF